MNITSPPYWQERKIDQSAGEDKEKGNPAMKGSENWMKASNNNGQAREKLTKPHFRPAKDDTKPVLQDPILRSDPIETEEAVLRLPPLPISKSTNPRP